MESSKEIVAKLRELSSCLSEVKRCVDQLTSMICEGDCVSDSMVDQVSQTHEDAERWASKILEEKCPRCGSPKIEKTDKTNGEKFVGCSNYPQCSYRQKKNDIGRKVTEAIEERKRRMFNVGRFGTSSQIASELFKEMAVARSRRMNEITNGKERRDVADPKATCEVAKTDVTPVSGDEVTPF